MKCNMRDGWVPKIGNFVRHSVTKKLGRIVSIQQDTITIELLSNRIEGMPMPVQTYSYVDFQRFELEGSILLDIDDPPSRKGKTIQENQPITGKYSVSSEFFSSDDVMPKPFEVWMRRDGDCRGFPTTVVEVLDKTIKVKGPESMEVIDLKLFMQLFVKEGTKLTPTREESLARIADSLAEIAILLKESNKLKNCEQYLAIQGIK
jgi:hypothetical protein